MHIGIAGNIGSGKTTLTTLLARHYGWTPKFESVTYNPYLADYYADIKRWSFALEMYFLQQRLHDVLEISKSKDVIIQDRTLFEGVHIFVANNYAQGNLSERDYNTYMDTFNVMMEVVHLHRISERPERTLREVDRKLQGPPDRGGRRQPGFPEPSGRFCRDYGPDRRGTLRIILNTQYYAHRYCR